MGRLGRKVKTNAGLIATRKEIEDSGMGGNVDPYMYYLC